MVRTKWKTKMITWILFGEIVSFCWRSAVVGLAESRVGAKKGLNIVVHHSYNTHLWLASDAPQRLDNATIPNKYRPTDPLAQPWHRWHPAFASFPHRQPIFLVQHHLAQKTRHLFSKFSLQIPHSSPPLSHNMHLNIHHQSRCI